MSSIKPPVTVTRPVSACLSIDKSEDLGTLRAKGVTDDALALDQVPQGVLTLLAQLQPRTDQAFKLGFKPHDFDPQLTAKSIDKKRGAQAVPKPALQGANKRATQPVTQTPCVGLPQPTVSQQAHTQQTSSPVVDLQPALEPPLPPQSASETVAVAQPIALTPEAREQLQASDALPVPLQPLQKPAQEVPIVTGADIQAMPSQVAPSIVPHAVYSPRSAASPFAGNGTASMSASIANAGPSYSAQQERLPVSMGLFATSSHPAFLGGGKVASTAQPTAALSAGIGSLSLPEVSTQAQSNPPFPVSASWMSLMPAALMPKPLPLMMPVAATPQDATMNTPARASQIEPLTQPAELNTGLSSNLPEPRDQVALNTTPPTFVSANPAREPAVLSPSGFSKFTAEPLVKPEALTDKGPQHYLQVPFAKGDASSMITITKTTADQPQPLLLRPDNADISGYLSDRLAQVEEPRWRMADPQEREHEHSKGNHPGEQDEEQEEGGHRFFGAQRELV